MAQTRKIQLANPREGERDLPIDVLIEWGPLLENSKECFYNKPFFVTDFAPYEVGLDSDRK